LLTHNRYSFLSGAEPFLPTVPLEMREDAFTGELVFEHHHEGFIGIPHGGLAMGLCLDAWRRAAHQRYPVHAMFRFGGSGLAIGDGARFTVEQRYGQSGEPAVVARITKDGDRTPYLTAEITPLTTVNDMAVKPPTAAFRDLPYYRNCFVCGHHRAVTGLQRKFRYHGSESGKIVTTGWGIDSDDFDRVESFLIGRDEIHPAVLVSIFDENSAWGGFLDTGVPGLSVRLDFTLLRPVGKTEKLLFIGWPAGIKGNPRSPRFFRAEGAILCMNDPANAQPVAYGRGEWIVVDRYTEQIKRNLLPEGDWQWIFRKRQGQQALVVGGGLIEGG
jgi:hypothetical protein